MRFWQSQLSLWQWKWVSIIRLELSHRYLDPLRRKKGGYNPVSGGEGFPSLPAVREGRSGDHLVSRGQSEPLQGQRLGSQSGGFLWSSPATEVQSFWLERAWKVTSHFHRYAVTSLPCVEGRFGWSRERRGAFLQGVEGTTYQEDLVMLLLVNHFSIKNIL